jgi:hypothetical protein
MHPNHSPVPTPEQPTTCRHCGAPLMRVVTSLRHNLVGDVCTVGWRADWTPDTFPCGAPRGYVELPRYVLTELGRDALAQVAAAAWLFAHTPTVAEASPLAVAA